MSEPVIGLAKIDAKLAAADALVEAAWFIPGLLADYPGAKDDYQLWFYGEGETITIGDLRRIDAAIRQYQEVGK